MNTIIGTRKYSLTECTAALLVNPSGRRPSRPDGIAGSRRNIGHIFRH